MPTNNDPWYTRTEFWATLATMIGGMFGVPAVSMNPIAHTVGIALSGIAPIAYTLGRSNVKVAQAAAAAAAAGQALAPAN